ncbi:uncharacterized protein LACBIDRAFT_327715 [Laccaria bicolor S238N-H82]|uniref:Predicted protein n=1 Tax=Laccaria bicolor (strain S238N-H82 / ATCC MYA-4686) TaxID=486041 RepID=B0DCM8_LACBS|nr:uncharacterized protein LACBIDRAFT_327715 [Laccaria bicolor S238N-H82]EDR07758.1 predicted protein [Laccaria bicolor S238N-H82]|eukprot:XP_001881547.1 predicted protein [Laccaria bicolor S238N-H82]
MFSTPRSSRGLVVAFLQFCDGGFEECSILRPCAVIYALGQGVKLCSPSLYLVSNASRIETYYNPRRLRDHPLSQEKRASLWQWAFKTSEQVYFHDEDFVVRQARSKLFEPTRGRSLKFSPSTMLLRPIQDGHRRANSQATPRKLERGKAGSFQFQDLTCSRHPSSPVAIRSISVQ